MNLKKLAALCCCPIFLLPGLKSQDIETLLSKYTQDNGVEYMQPLADVFGASVNSGLFHSAKVKKMGFQVYLGVSTSAAFIPEKRKTFMADPEGFFNPANPGDVPIEVPTVFGEAETVVLPGQGGTQYLFPAGLNMNMVPLAIPQLTIGSVFGTNLTLRYFSLNVNDDFGKIDVFGWGLKHSISQYIPLLPVDLAAGAYFQNFHIGNFVDASSYLVNIQASRRLLLFTFYGGIGYGNSNLDIEYTSSSDDTGIALNLEGSNSIRLTTGITFNLGPVKLNTDYNFASQGVLTVGLGLGFGE